MSKINYFVWACFFTIFILCFPCVAVASNGNEPLVVVGFLLVTFVCWFLAILFCRMGGGWILLGVIIGIFIALPLSGYVLLITFSLGLKY